MCVGGTFVIISLERGAMLCGGHYQRPGGPNSSVQQVSGAGEAGKDREERESMEASTVFGEGEGDLCLMPRQ